MPDAYLVDGEIIDPTEVTPLESVRSFDHGLRCADETAVVIGTEAADYVMGPLLALYGVSGHVDHWAAMNAALNIDYSGGWLELTGDMDGSFLYEWAEEMTDAMRGVGYIVETNADCGMTWFYRPVPS